MRALLDEQIHRVVSLESTVSTLQPLVIVYCMVVKLM